jgi:hypothetical protein
MGGGRKGKKSKKKKTYTKAQKMAQKRIAAKKAAEAGGFSSKSFTSGMPSYSSLTSKKEATKTFGPSAKTGPSFSRKSGTTGIGPVADGAKYAAALKKSPPRFSSGTMEQQKAAVRDGTLLAGDYTSPTVKNYGLRPDGVHGYYKVGDVINTGGKSGKDFQFDGKNWNRVGVDLALGGDNLGSGFGIAGSLGMFGLGLKGIGDAIEGGKRLKENIEKRLNPEETQNQSSLGIGTLISAINPVANLTNLGISPASATTKSADSFGYPSQEAVDKAAGITAGGLNIGGAGFTPTNLNDPTVRAAAAYKSTLNPDSFKGLSDGETFGSGPVASGEDYARGLNVGYDNAENVMRRFVDEKLPMIDAIPGVNTRRLTDKEIADKRMKAQKMRKEMMTGRKGSGGAKRLSATPTVIEELLPEAVPVASKSTTPSTQTGIDPNRLLQIQQQAYAQAYNPMTIGGFNPQFRFGAATPTIDYSTYFNY